MTKAAQIALKIRSITHDHSSLLVDQTCTGQSSDEIGSRRVQYRSFCYDNAWTLTESTFLHEHFQTKGTAAEEAKV